MTVSTVHHAVDFRPSRVEGVADVQEVRVTRNRLELLSAGKWLTFPFLSFAPGREIGSGRVPVGELHFAKSHYPDSHFVFYTTPRIAIYMPTEGPTAYPDSVFWRVQEVIRNGGLRLYEDGKRLPEVLDVRAARTPVYVLIVFLLAWLLMLSGFLPGRAGEAMRHFFLSNPRNPAIGVPLTLPALVVAILLTFRHGRTAAAVLICMASSYVLALTSAWAMRSAIHSWAPIEQPPWNLPFWSAHQFTTLLIAIVAVSLVALTWRRAFLEPIPESERVGGASAMCP
jgi:hypothetical protein